jgi:hypothetical protein
MLMTPPVHTLRTQVAIVYMHVTRTALTGNLLPSLVAAQAVLLFFRLNFFSRLFASRFNFLDSLKQVRDSSLAGVRRRQAKPSRAT